VKGSPSLAHIIKKTALDVAHPTVAGKTLWDATLDDGPFKDLWHNNTIDADFLENYNLELERHKMKAQKTQVLPLGSGSDYTVFLQRLGVASSDQGFGGTATDAPYHYHSIYDTQSWQERYADPGFHRHVSVLATCYRCQMLIWFSDSQGSGCEVSGPSGLTHRRCYHRTHKHDTVLA